MQFTQNLWWLPVPVIAKSNIDVSQSKESLYNILTLPVSTALTLRNYSASEPSLVWISPCIFFEVSKIFTAISFVEFSEAGNLGKPMH